MADFTKNDMPSADGDVVDAETSRLSNMKIRDSENAKASSPRIESTRSVSPTRERPGGEDKGRLSLSPPSTQTLSNDGLPWPAQWEHAAASIEASNQKIVIAVASPELVSSMMSKHVTYSVKTEPLGYTVRRRYNDFAWLRDSICSRYVGLFIPQIPSTTMFSTKQNITGSKTDIGGDFVKNRMSQLNLFMQQLCSIPFIRTDPGLLAFISIQSEKEFKQITETPVTQVKLAATGEVTNNMGLNQWFAMVDRTNIDAAVADRSIADFRRQLDVLRTTLDQIDKECRLVGKKASLAAREMNNLADQVANWTQLETDLLDPAKNEYQNQHGAKLRVYMNSLATGHNNWAQNLSLIPKVIARILLSSIQFQLVQVEGFRTHLAFRDQQLKELDRAEKEKLRALEEKHRAASSGVTPPKRTSVTLFTKKGDDLEADVVKKTDAVNNLQAIVSRTTKGLIFCEMDRFHKERLQNIGQLLGSLAAAHIQISQASTTKWSEMVAVSGLDTAMFADTITSLYNSIDEEEIFGDA